MALLAWPLERNRIRRDKTNNAYGMVRNGGSRAHQGWDLVAAPGTDCFAIADGVIVSNQYEGALGNVVLLKFEHQGRELYAAYCHLSLSFTIRDKKVSRGDIIGYTGNTGNAAGMHGEDQHLHFEIRAVRMPRSGLHDRIDPASLYGMAPIGWTFFEGHGRKITLTGLGLKVKGFNVRERIE